MAGKRGNKYGAKKAEVDGLVFDSKAEARRYVELQKLQAAGDISGLELQVPYQLIPKQRRPDGKAERACAYVADFRYITRGGDLVIEDVKSPATRTRDYVIKRKLMLDRFGIALVETT